MSVEKDDVLKIIKNLSAVYEENKEYLTELDAAIGDGDHGINLNKGFKAAISKLNSSELNTISDVIKITAMALISNVGGASGPLYGTLFLKASAASINSQDVDIILFRNMLSEGIEGIKMRGKAVQGEKTMLDVLIPVLDSINQSIEDNEEPVIALEKAVQAADESVEFTKTIAATKGRASYVGERSIGHIDPGAKSSYLLVKTIYDTVKK